LPLLQCCAGVSEIFSLGLTPLVWADLKALGLSEVLLLSLLGIILFLASLFNFEAYKRGKIGVIDTVLTLELPVTILLGFLFLHEQLNSLQLLLVGFLMLGIYLVSTAGRKLSFRLEKGVLLALAAVVGVGIVNFLVAVSSMNISPLLAIWFPWTLSVILCLIVLMWHRDVRSIMHNFSKYPWLILAMAIFDTAAWCFYAFALRDGELGIITAITESYPVIALLLGVTIGRERIVPWQYIGCAVALLASISLALML
jgi:drug/metabolite transporter (DMT)-like permease